MRSLVAPLAVLAMASGCDTVFGVHGTVDGGTADGDAVVDVIDAGPDVACSPMTLLGDNFTQDHLKTNWPNSYVKSGASDSITVAGGHLVFRVTSDDGYAILSTPLYYDFRNQMFSLSFLESNSTPNDPSAAFRIFLTSAYSGPFNHNHQLALIRIGGTIRVEALDDQGVGQSIGEHDYDPTMDAYVRMGMREGFAVFETSPDGANWHLQGQVAYDHMDLVQPYMEIRQSAGTYQVSVNKLLGGAPFGTACDIDSLADTFDAAPLSDTWFGSAPGPLSSMSVDNGQLEIHSQEATGQGNESFLRAALPYDFREGALFFQVPKMWMSDGSKYLQLIVEGFDHQIKLEAISGLLKISYAQDNTTPQLYSQPLLPNDTWWKIEHAGNTTSFSLSSDGINWHGAASTSQIRPFSAAQIYFRAVEQSTPDDMAIDNVNTHP